MRFYVIVASRLHVSLWNLLFVLASLGVSVSHLCKIVSGLNFVHEAYEVLFTLVRQLLKFALVLIQPGDLVAGL